MISFEDIKVGDFVILVAYRSGMRDQVLQVTRVWPRKFEAGKHRYWKKNGLMCGSSSPDYKPYVIPYDPDRGEKIAEAEFRDQFVQRMQRRKWHNISTDAMRRILTIIVAEEAGS